MLIVPLLPTNTPMESQELRLVQEASPRCRIARAGRERLLTSVYAVYDGDVLTTPAGGSITLVFKESGRRWKTSGFGKVRVEPKTIRRLSGPAPQPLTPVATPFRRLAESADGGRWFKAGGVDVRSGLVVRGDFGPRDLRPSGALLGPPIEVRWGGNVVGDRVRIRFEAASASDANGPKADFDVPNAPGRAAVPALDLEPGKTYIWSVKAEDGTMAATRIRIVTPAERREIEALGEAERIALGSADVGPLVLVGYGYESFGRYEDARRVYALLARRLPRDEGIRRALARAGRNARPDKADDED